MKFFVIGDREAVLGFRLVGVEGVEASGRDDALAALHKAMSRKEIGVILMTEKIAREIRDEFEARLYGLGFPLILEIPDASGPVADRLRVEDVVRRAIGMSI